MTRVALDTGILAYLAGVSRDARDDAKIELVRNMIGRLSSEVSLVAPAQTLGELFVVLRRGGASAEEALAILLEFAQAFGNSASEARTALAAADLVVDQSFQFWDALIVIAATVSTIRFRKRSARFGISSIAHAFSSSRLSRVAH